MTTRMQYTKAKMPHSRRSQSRRPARVVGTATTVAAGALTLVLIAPNPAPGSNPSTFLQSSVDHVLAAQLRLASTETLEGTQLTPLQSAIDQVLATQQQVISTQAAAYPGFAPSDQDLLGQYTQHQATEMLSYLFNLQNINQSYLPTYPYPWTASAAEPQPYTGGAPPDNVYSFLPVTSDETYTITVHPGPGTEDLSFSPIGGYSLSTQTAPQTLGFFDLTQATPNPDGSYTIVLSSTEQSGNWVDTSGANQVWIRNTMGDWGAQPDQLSISPSDGPSASIPVLSNNHIASMLNAIAANMPANNENTSAVMDIIHGVSDNGYTPIGLTATVGTGGALTTQFFSFGNFSVDPGDAVIVKVPNIEAAFTGIQLTNYWTPQLPDVTVTGSLNDTQAFEDPGGYTYYVISDTNPGVANWLDTSGAVDGGVLLRWQLPAESSPPDTAIQTEVVPVADVRDYLPADTPTVTPAEYAAEIQERLLSYDYALDTAKNIGWVTNNLQLDQIKLAMGDDQFSQVFGGQQDVPSILDRLTTPALNPNWGTVVHDLLTNPDGSLSAVINNLPVAVKDIELPMVLALLRPEVIFAQTAENVQTAIMSDQWSQVLPALSQGLQGLGSAFSDTWTDPTTSITAGILNAYNDLAVSIMNADTYSALSSSDVMSVFDQLSQFDQSVSEMLTAGFSVLLDPADTATLWPDMAANAGALPSDLLP